MPHNSVTPLQKMQNAIQLAAFHYIVCLKTTPTNADHSINIEGKRKYDFQGIRTASSRQLHVDFQSWAAVSVLRDLVESFSILLYEIYESAVLNNPKGQFSSTPAIFERRGIEFQLSILTKDFGIDPAWVSRLTGYNRARNCMAHRAGIVAKSDVTDGKELVVRWLVPGVAPHDGPISQKIDVHGPMGTLVQGTHINGKAAHVFLLDRNKRILVGETIHFLPDEILDICQTFQLAAAAFASLSQPLSGLPPTN